MVRKKRVQEQKQNENNTRLEQIVHEVMQLKAQEKEKVANLNLATTTTTATPATIQQMPGEIQIHFPRDKRSYQEAMNRPISIISSEPPSEAQVRNLVCTLI